MLNPFEHPIVVRNDEDRDQANEMIKRLQTGKYKKWFLPALKRMHNLNDVQVADYLGSVLLELKEAIRKYEETKNI